MLAVCHELLDEDRLNNLEVAKELYFRFFERLIQYRLMPADRPEAKVLKRLLVEDHADEEEERLLLWLQRPLRDLKIERMKKIRQMKADLSSLSIPDSSSSEDAVLVYWFQCLQLHFLVALDNVSLLLQEIELLRTGSQSSKREIEPVEEKSKVSKITQPFKLIRDRRTIAADVFKPDYNLPTMTIDEYLELEMKRGNIISGGGNTNNPTQDEDSESFLEAKLKKDREFDEFKDSKEAHLRYHLFFTF